uniref:uncharacterized protein LOC118525702 n=1 Tax=Halichoerus grypus TaxID=9711 RepID=UPI00165A0B9F|nr:uncharacterized protein LOC118525702 [Halichoerus grypus]
MIRFLLFCSCPKNQISQPRNQDTEEDEQPQLSDGGRGTQTGGKGWGTSPVPLSRDLKSVVVLLYIIVMKDTELDAVVIPEERLNLLYMMICSLKNIQKQSLAWYSCSQYCYVCGAQGIPEACAPSRSGCQQQRKAKASLTGAVNKGTAQSRSEVRRLQRVGRDGLLPAFLNEVLWDPSPLHSLTYHGGSFCGINARGDRMGCKAKNVDYVALCRSSPIPDLDSHLPLKWEWCRRP